MSMINIEELNKINTEREKQNLEIYDKVLKKCHEKIKKTAKLPKKHKLFLCGSYIYLWRSKISNRKLYCINGTIFN